MIPLQGFMPPKAKELAKLKRDLSSWSKTAALAYGTDDYKDVYKLLYVETVTQDRDYNVIRLYQRFNRLRCNAELKDLSKFLARVKHVPELKTHLVNSIKLDIYLDAVGQSQKLYQQLMRIELLNQNRPYMIRLLHGRFQKLRRREERALL